MVVITVRLGLHEPIRPHRLRTSPLAANPHRTDLSFICVSNTPAASERKKCHEHLELDVDCPVVRAFLAVLASAPAFLAEPARGDLNASRSLHIAQCAKCHEVVDSQGERPETLEVAIKVMVDSKIPHRPTVELTEAQIKNLAAYWSAGQ
jgi:cytochrome c553